MGVSGSSTRSCENPVLSSPSESGIPARLRRLRCEAGQLQKDCAGALAISPDAYRHIESGRTSLRADRLVELAALLGCSVEDIVDPAPDVFVVDRWPSVEYRRRLLRAWHLFDEAGRERHQGNWAGAEEKARRILENTLPADLEALVVLLLVDCRLMQGRLVEAINDLRGFMDRMPNQPALTLLRVQLSARLGDLYLRRGHTDKAEEQYRRGNSLLRGCRLPGVVLERAWSQKRTAQVLLARREPDKALGHAHGAHQTMLELGHSLGASRTSYVLGWAYQEKAQRRREGRPLALRAVGYHKEGIRLCLGIADVEGLAKGLFYVAEDYRKLRDFLPGTPELCLLVSERIARRALSMLEPPGDGLLRGRIQRNLGLVELDRALIAKAARMYGEARHHAEMAVAHLESALAMDDLEMPGRIPGLLMEIAEVKSLCLGQHEAAMGHMEQACLLAGAIDHPLQKEYLRQLEGLRLSHRGRLP